MAKHVTEEDLASGLSGFGDGLSTITERPRRDSPFRDTRSEPEEKVSDKEEKVVEMRPAALPQYSTPERVQNTARQHPQAPRDEPIQRPFSSQEATRVDIRGHESRTRTVAESARQVRVHYPEPEEVQAPAVRKADIFTERVTLSVSSEMRDEVEALARELQRRRTKKDERITANTVMRVAIRSLLDRFNLEDWEVANTEAELLELALKKAR